MSVLETLKNRSDNQCELSKTTDNLTIYALPPESDLTDSDKCIFISQTYFDQLTGKTAIDTNLWRCLGESMWSNVPAVQVVTYRQLQALSSESWAQDLLAVFYLDEATQSWADKGLAQYSVNDKTPTLDANGTALQNKDNVIIIKDLQVKGAGFTAKRGTIVRNISLTENPLHIEGRVNGTLVVLVSQYLKKT